MAAVSRPVAFLAGFGLIAVVGLLLTNPAPEPAKATAARRRTPVKKDGDDWNLPAPDPKLAFAHLTGVPRNVFVPLVVPERAVGLPKAEVEKDDLVQIPGKLAAGEGAWTYTGMVEANGVRMALLENKGLNQAGYVREGEAWKTARIVGITSACIVLADAKGLTETVFRFDPNAPVKPKAETPPAFGPGGVGPSPVGPIAPGGAGFAIRPTLSLPDPSRTFPR